MVQIRQVIALCGSSAHADRFIWPSDLRTPAYFAGQPQHTRFPEYPHPRQVAPSDLRIVQARPFITAKIVSALPPNLRAYAVQPPVSTTPDVPSAPATAAAGLMSRLGLQQWHSQVSTSARSPFSSLRYAPKALGAPPPDSGTTSPASTLPSSTITSTASQSTAMSVEANSGVPPRGWLMLSGALAAPTVLLGALAARVVKKQSRTHAWATSVVSFDDNPSVSDDELDGPPEFQLVRDPADEWMLNNPSFMTLPSHAHY